MGLGRLLQSAEKRLALHQKKISEKTGPDVPVADLLALYVSHRRERKRTGKEREHICIDGEKYDLRGTQTHTFYYPGRCPSQLD
jgi:hypothetical protein